MLVRNTKNIGIYMQSVLKKLTISPLWGPKRPQEFLLRLSIVPSVLQAFSAVAAGVFRGKFWLCPPVLLHTDNFLDICPILMLSLLRCFKLSPLTNSTHFSRIFGRACA